MACIIVSVTLESEISTKRQVARPNVDSEQGDCATKKRRDASVTGTGACSQLWETKACNTELYASVTAPIIAGMHEYDDTEELTGQNFTFSGDAKH